MVKLLEKVLNCYKAHLTNLTYGITNRNYSLLYGAVLLLKNNITEDRFVEYFYNNLTCTGNIVLPQTEEELDLISWTINSSDVVLENFVFTSFSAPTVGTYSITTNSVVGYNFLYITAPENRGVKIYDSLTELVFDSSVPSENYEFSEVGEIIVSNNKTNKVYRKNNVYNSYNPVTYYIKIY